MRRHATALVLALIAVLVLPAAASAQNARPADAFVDSIGVNVHLGYTDTVYYERLAAVAERLGELGIRHVRDDFVPDSPALDAGLVALAGRGVHSTLILGDPDDPGGELPAMLAKLKTGLAGSVEAVEGPNEYSTRGGPEWQPKLAAYQRRLWEAVKGDPALAALPVLGPSIVHNDQQALGDLSAYLDFGSVHSYPEGGPPENRINLLLERAKFNSAEKPVMATESGYTDALGWTPAGPGENKPVSEAAAGVYVPRLFFEYWTRGIARSFDYELVDLKPNPALDQRELHFGLLRNDLTPKPAFDALRNTIAILADPGPAFVPGALDLTVAGGAVTLHSALLAKRDGSFYLALWRLQSVWDPDAKQPLAPTPEAATVTVPAGLDGYEVFDPSAAATAVAIGGATGAVTLPVGAGVTILRLIPAGSGPALPPAPPALTQVTPFAPPTLPIPPLLRPAAHCVVPALVGRRLAAARARLRQADCSLGRVRVRRALGGTPGRVVHQSGRPGTVLPTRSKIAVTVARPERPPASGATGGAQRPLPGAADG